MRTLVISHRAARNSLIAAILLFLTGAFLSCSCPGWFACTAALSLVPVIWGTKSAKVIGAIVLVASAISAVTEFQEDQQIKARVRELRERYQNQPKPNSKATEQRTTESRLLPASIRAHIEAKLV